MQPTSLQESLPQNFTSPKRKREADPDDIDMVDIARSPLRLRIELPSRPIVSSGHGHDHSPRTKMSNQMQDLKLQQEHQTVQQSAEGAAGDAETQATIKPTLPPLQLPEPIDNVGSITTPEVRLARASTPKEVPETPQASFGVSSSSHGPSLEPPATPALRPAGSPLGAPQSISPLPGPEPMSFPLPETVPALSSPSPSPTKRRKSPPPSSITSDLVWSDSEITGHNPDDPQDDGYGINGIGFRPTPAIAQARSMRRKQQVADWRSREAREARSRRAERRRGVGIGMASGGNMTAENESTARRVRFVEG